MPKNKVSVSFVSTGEKHKSKPNKIEIVPFTIKKTLLTEENDLIIANIWSYVNILDTKSQTFLCCTSS